MKPYDLNLGEGLIVGAAVHDGHDLRPEVQKIIALTETQRLREEDPFTAEWARLAPSSIVGRRSRFEVDLNRPRDIAVYQKPDDAWGLTVWRQPPGKSVVEEGKKIYDDFYHDVHSTLRRLIDQHQRIVVLDLHTYNHRRDGANAPAADPRANPEVNIGTGTMDRQFWAPVVERFMSDLKAFDFGGRSLDVRENVKFQGGHFSKMIHDQFPEQVCAPAIEFKKFFMDEWTGEPDRELVQLIGSAIQSTYSGIREEIMTVKSVK